MTNKIKSKKKAPSKVIEFLDNLEHPRKKEIMEVRKIILGSNNQLTEHIKWNAPSYCFNDDDRITFNLHGKDFFRLIFHCGAKVKAKGSGERLFEDTSGLLDWASGERAIAKFTDMDDVHNKKESLVKIIKTWLTLTT